jgi:hypothetical protein
MFRASSLLEGSAWQPQLIQSLQLNSFENDQVNSLSLEEAPPQTIIHAPSDVQSIIVPAQKPALPPMVISSGILKPINSAVETKLVIPSTAVWQAAHGLLNWKNMASPAKIS